MHGSIVPLASHEASSRDQKKLKKKNTMHLDALYDVKYSKCSSGGSSHWVR